MHDVALPLAGLFLHLVQAGFPLSVRDYQDALAALRRGHGSGDRDRLHWLCRTLWARGDDEVARLEALFRAFPRPTPQQVQRLSGAAEAAEALAGSETGGDEPGAAPSGASASRDGLLPSIEFTAPTAGAGGLPSARYRQPPARHYVFEPRPLVGQRALTVAWRRFRRAQRSGPKTELDIDATVAEQCRVGRLLAPVWVAPRRNQATIRK